DWGVRVSDAYRSKYYTGLGTVGNVGDYIAATHNIDFQAHVNLTKGVRLIAEGINLTNEPIEQFAGGPIARRVVYTTSGRTFTFGVSAEF
ncbi:TonB-dependent receptor, partial [Serratia marcescens]